MQLIDREILPRHDRGLDWTSRRRVVVRTTSGKALLFIREAGMISMSVPGFGRTPVPAALILVKPGDQLGTRLQEGRVFARDILKHAKIIDGTFGAGASSHIDLARTLVVEDRVPGKKGKTK